MEKGRKRFCDYYEREKLFIGKRKSCIVWEDLCFILDEFFFCDCDLIKWFVYVYLL